jgi:biopolymer transport protein TolR
MRPRRAKPILIQEVRSTINVTPLVDVCLVLLIIFMVVTPMLQKGIDVALPETVKPDKMPESSKQLDVSVKKDGSVYISQNWVPDDRVQNMLKDIHEASPDKSVVVKGDKRLKYKQVRKVMEMLNEAGFSRVGLVLEKQKGSGAGGTSG